MRINTVVTTVVFAAVATAMTPNRVSAAEITFLCAPALQPAIQELVPEFEKASGHKVKIVYGSIGINASRVRNGEEADFAIVSPQQWQALSSDGKLGSNERRTIGKVGIGVFAKKGAARPAIGSVDAFKGTLVQARSIAVGDPKTPVGAYMLPLFERLGLASDISAKLLLMPPGNPSPTIEAVIKSRAEIGISQMSEILASPDVDALGPLPVDIQNFTTFTAAIPAQAKQAAAANDLIEFLRTPSAVALLRSKGVDAD
jgi:molybdate transport system substrate-binding protein